MDSVKFVGDDNNSYHFYDWGEWGKLAYLLAEKILSQETKYTRIVALATGGLTLSRAMKDYLNIKNLSTLQISFYTGIGKRGDTPIIRESIPVNVEGERILIFDDINDTGASLETAKHYLSLRGAKEVTTATIFQKPSTKYPSDFFAQEVSDWVIFPDEIRETITPLTSNWTKEGLSEQEIRSRLLRIGFSEFHIDLIRKHP